MIPRSRVSTWAVIGLRIGVSFRYITALTKCFDPIYRVGVQRTFKLRLQVTVRVLLFPYVQALEAVEAQLEGLSSCCNRIGSP
jgi:hypothetical protein